MTPQWAVWSSGELTRNILYSWAISLNVILICDVRCHCNIFVQNWPLQEVMSRHCAKGSIGHAFTVCIRTENQNQVNFRPFALRDICRYILLYMYPIFRMALLLILLVGWLPAWHAEGRHSVRGCMNHWWSFAKFNGGVWKSKVTFILDLVISVID